MDDLRDAYAGWLLRQLAAPQDPDIELVIFDSLIAPLVEALETLEAQHSGVVGSIRKGDCMAIWARTALTALREKLKNAR